jgi:GT2 family glycosyltransferase
MELFQSKFNWFQLRCCGDWLLMSASDKKDFQVTKLFALIAANSEGFNAEKNGNALVAAVNVINNLLELDQNLKKFVSKKDNVREFLEFFDLDFIRTQMSGEKTFQNDLEVYLFGYFISDSKNIINSPFLYLILTDPEVKELISKKVITPKNYNLWLLLAESKKIALPEKFMAPGNSNIVSYAQLLKFRNSVVYYYLFRAVLLGKGLVRKDDRCIIKNVNKINFKKFNKIEVSIIIPVYGAIELLNQCLISLHRSNLQNYEIICVDDCAPSNTPYDYDFYGNIVVVKNDGNQGFSNTCNNGVKHAKGECVLLLNSDTIVTNTAIENALAKLKSNSKIGLVGSKLINIDGSVQEAGGVIWSDTRVENFMRGKSSRIPYVEFDRVSGYVSGAALFSTKKIWDELGGFDQKFTPAYYEDTDICVRARSKGYKVYYCHDSEIIHAEGGTNGTDVTTGIKSYQEKNKNKFSLLWKKYIEKTFPSYGDVFGNIANGRKIVVFVDHYIPKQASDAGSKATIHLIDYFIEQDYFVIFWPDNLYPDDENRKILAKKGVMIVYGAEFINKFGSFIRSFESRIEKIILSRPHISIKYISQIKGELVNKTVYLGHDIHYERMNRENRILFNDHYLFFADNDSVKEARRQEVSLWNFCDKVAYFTKREAEIVNQITRTKKAIVIPLFKNRNISSFKEKPSKNRSGFLFVGGFDHQPNKDGLLWLLSGLDKHGNTLFSKLTIVGSKIPDDLKRILTIKGIVFYENVSNARLDEIYSKAAVVIAPLRYGSGFKGKVLEAIERNIPVVTTTIGYEGFDLPTSIRPCNNLNDFVDQMHLLDHNENERNKICEMQFEMLKKYFQVAKYTNIFGGK